MPPVATTPRRMEALSRALDRAVASWVVPRPRIDQLRSAFVATDAQGTSWTIDPEFQRWGRLDGERWLVADPPAQLFMDSELRAALEAVEAMAARAIMTGADALHAPRDRWFRTQVAPAETAEMPAPMPTPGLDPASPTPRETERAPMAEPARTPAPMAPQAPEVAAMDSKPNSAPATRAPDPEPVPMPAVISPPASDALPEEVPDEPPRDATEAATPRVSASDIPRSEIPEAHLRFAGPVAMSEPGDAEPAAHNATPTPARRPASVESRAPVPRDASLEAERWIPTSIAPRLTAERLEVQDDRAHVFLCLLLGILFFALGVWKNDGRGYAGALLFVLLAVTLLVLNLSQSRHD